LHRLLAHLELLASDVRSARLQPQFRPNMLATPPVRGSVRHSKFHERLSRQLSPQMTTSLGLLLDPSTVERHNMANGFGSGLPVSSQVAPSSRESSPSGARASRRHSAEFYFDDGNVVFLVRTIRTRETNAGSRYS